MNDSVPALRGDAVEDDIQLDGSRHLTIDASDVDREWFAVVQLVFDAERQIREGEVTLEGPGEPWSGAIQDILDLETNGYFRLRALFGDPEAPEEAVVVEMEEDEAGSYHVIVARD